MRIWSAFSVVKMARAVFTVALAYLLVFQSLASAIDASKALHKAQLELSALCAPADHGPLPDAPDDGPCPDMPCCVPGGRLALNLAIIPSAQEPILFDSLLFSLFLYPPQRNNDLVSKIELKPLQPRAPPARLI